jgi:imidazolonepropionase-like amidohydrolase
MITSTNHFVALSAILCGALLIQPLTAQDTTVVTGGRVITVTGQVIEEGTVVIENGRITDVGPKDSIEAAWEARVIDATGKVVMPTWVLAHSQGGVRGATENMQNVPFVNIADALDPASSWFQHCLRSGVGTVHTIPGNATLLGGMGLVVRPYGRTVADMSVATQSGIKLSLSNSRGGRLQQIRQLRRALQDAREHLAEHERKKAEFERAKAAGAVPEDKEWDEELDRTKKPVIDLLQKKLRGWLYVPTSAELPEAMRLAEEMDLVFVLGSRMHDAADMLVKHGHTVVLDDTLEYYETDPETGEEVMHEVAGVLAKAGVPFSLSITENGPNSNPWWQLATCVRQGVDRKTAIESLTITPARLLGLQDQVGSIEKGKLGNLQILTGDPMQATTWVETVVLEGQVVYERTKDQRLQYLLEQPADAPTATEGK